MAGYTSLRIGGPADVIVFPEDPVSVKNILLTAGERKIPVFVLGAGTNLLVRDGGIEGIVVCLRAFKRIKLLNETEDGVTVFVEAGGDFQRLINFAREKGYSGIENLVGIPGTVGGAIRMNTGAFNKEIKDVIISAVVLDKSGRLSKFNKKELGFSYRRSNIENGSIIFSANIFLRKNDPKDIEKRMKEYLEKKRITQPLRERSAGCVFKNPPADSAGRLIEIAGCKGMRIGDAEVSAVHANYIITKGKATAKDFIKLMDAVKDKVREKCGISLSPEIEIVGRNG
ncbi:MAG TPA: hypothetical protein DEP99_05745 [Nitrospiraceae bacterium]|nr:hypothetical protein [Nitrospiraceae bacterium]